MHPSILPQLSLRYKILAIAAFVGIGVSIAIYSMPTSNSRPNSIWKYRFARPEAGSVTKNIRREITFHQQKIQQQPDRKSTRLNSSHRNTSRMPSSA